jgi:formamidase
VAVPKRIAFDVRTPLVAAPEQGHNRWHPDIPPLLTVSPGDRVVLDVRDGLDGQFTAESGSDDVLNMDLGRGHPLTGPIFIEGAEPGDLLEVETLAIEPDRFGFTCIIPGVGLLKERFDKPYLVRWVIEGGVARSADLPGVSIRGAPFLGVAGVSPSPERLAMFLARETALAEQGGEVLLPDPRSAVPGEPVASKGLRTVPPRETGGNMDVKQLTVGSRLVLPVDVPGALFSAGDAHFAQGDGETCGVAIEMHATAELRFGLRKAREVGWRPRYPMLEYTEPSGPTRGRRCVVTTGLPIDAAGRNADLDLNVAAAAALNEMVDYIAETHGYTSEQAYVLASVAADLRIGSVPNIPNVLVTAVLPLDIFDGLD